MTSRDPSDDEGEWLYQFPRFLSRLEAQGAMRVSDAVDANLGGVVYHHRGARVPAHEATFVWEDETFSLELDAVGDRGGWARFDADAEWDAFIGKRAGQPPAVVWMCDAEFDAEEEGRAGDKREAIALGRYSFGCHLHAPETWAQKRRRASLSAAPFFLHRPDGRTVVPDANVDLAAYEEAIPPELRGQSPLPHLGLVEAVVETE